MSKLSGNRKSSAHGQFVKRTFLLILALIPLWWAFRSDILQQTRLIRGSNNQALAQQNSSPLAVPLNLNQTQADPNGNPVQPTSPLGVPLDPNQIRNTQTNQEGGPIPVQSQQELQPTATAAGNSPVLQTTENSGQPAPTDTSTPEATATPIPTVSPEPTATSSPSPSAIPAEGTTGVTEAPTESNGERDSGRQNRSSELNDSPGAIETDTRVQDGQSDHAPPLPQSQLASNANSLGSAYTSVGPLFSIEMIILGFLCLIFLSINGLGVAALVVTLLYIRSRQEQPIP